jgi:zinc transport system permease protein
LKLQFEFMRNALAAGLLASVICGIMGTLVVVNRIVFFPVASPMRHMAASAWRFILAGPIWQAPSDFRWVAAMVMAAVSQSPSTGPIPSSGSYGRLAWPLASS